MTKKQQPPPGSININQTGDQNAAQTGSGKQVLTKTVAEKPKNQTMRFSAGAILMLVAAGFAAWGFYKGTLTQDERRILLAVLPLACGTASAAFAGGISAKYQGAVPGLVITATGGFAVWLITFFGLFPASSVAPSSPPIPPATTAPAGK